MAESMLFNRATVTVFLLFRFFFGEKTFPSRAVERVNHTPTQVACHYRLNTGGYSGGSLPGRVSYVLYNR